MEISTRTNLEEIIEACKKSNRRAQELVYSMYSSTMLGICYRYAKDRAEAEDILQIGFLKVFDKIESFKGEGSFEGWIKRIMVNTSIEFYRKSLRMLPVSGLIEEHDQLEQEQYNPISNLNVKDILKEIQKLSPGYRMVFNMHAIEGYNHKEIAEILNISEGTSKSQLARARGILQESVKKMGGYKNEKVAK